MAKKVYCCPGCGAVYYAETGKTGRCMKCGGVLKETGYTADAWEQMSADAQRAVIRDCREGMQDGFTEAGAGGQPSAGADGQSPQQAASEPFVLGLLSVVAGIAGAVSPVPALIGLVLGIAGLVKRNKKVLCIIGIVLSVLMLAASAGRSGDESRREISGQAESSAAAPQGESNAAAAGSAETSGETGDRQAAKGDTTIESQVLLDAEGVRVTAESFSEDTFWGDGINLLIENDSDRNVGVGTDAVIVNNYMISDIFSKTVAAGKKANETLDLMSTELEAAGIVNIGQIEVYLHLFDPDSYSTFYRADPVTIRTSRYDQMDTEPNDDGTELYNANGFRIVGKYVDEDSFWGNAIVLYLENNTDRNVTFQCDDMSVNGYMVTPYFSCTVYAGKMAVSDITLMQSELDQNGITAVGDVELTFHIFDDDTYDTIVDTDPITFSAKQ